ncbi:MAG: hypothetical protein ACXITV_00185 [Luteibaculaceae bacterium]
MDSIKFPLMFATYYLFIYVIFASVGTLNQLAMFLFSLSPVIVIWMVIRVLKDGKPSEKTFETDFYDTY